MRAVIPFKKSNAKSRLSSLLSEKEREELAMAMLNDVAGTLVSSGGFEVVDILSTSMINVEGVNIVLTELGLNEALNEYLRRMSIHKINEPVLIIMADIPLVTIKNIKDIISTKADIVIAPGRMGERMRYLSATRKVSMWIITVQVSLSILKSHPAFTQRSLILLISVPT